MIVAVHGQLATVRCGSSRGDGIILRSTDGGASFDDITPCGGIPSVHRCTVLADGRIAVSGAEGWVGVYTP